MYITLNNFHLYIMNTVATVDETTEVAKVDITPVQEQLKKLEEINREEAEEHERHTTAASEEAKLHQANMERIQERKQSTMDALQRALENIEGFDFEKQCARFLETRETFGLNNDNAPTAEQFGGWYNAERQEAASKLCKPTVVIGRNNETFEQYVKAIDESGLAQCDTYVNESVFKPQETPEDDGWRIDIVDGAQEMEVASYDDNTKILGERIAAAQEHRKANNLSGLDRKKSALLFMQSLKDGNPVDQTYYTLLDEDEACEGNVVPRSYWSGDLVGFGRGFAGDRRGGARFRSSVGGDVVS